VKILDSRARAALSQYVAQSPQELAFLGGALSESCVVVDAVEASDILTPVTREIRTTAEKSPPAENVRGVLDAFVNASQRVVRRWPPGAGDPNSVARTTAQALSDRALAIVNALPAYDDASRATKTSAISLAQDWKQLVARPLYDAASVRQLDDDLRHFGKDADKVFRNMFENKVKSNDLIVVPLYAVAIGSRLHIVSNLAKSLLSALVSSAKVDEALRVSSTFDAARTSGCLSEKPALIEALLALELRELGPDFVDKLSQDEKR
jgi:hypothetical protein